jgi:hypothetical protein
LGIGLLLSKCGLLRQPQKIAIFYSPGHSLQEAELHGKMRRTGDASPSQLFSQSRKNEKAVRRHAGLS